MENPSPPAAASPFRPGTMVVVTLANPREKFWGAILALSPEGLSLRGIELASFEDLVALVKDGEPFPWVWSSSPCTASSAWNSICPTATSLRSRSASPPKPGWIQRPWWRLSLRHLARLRSADEVLAASDCSESADAVAHAVSALHRRQPGRRPLPSGAGAVRACRAE